MNYSVTTTPAQKVTITIARKQLWRNFLASWGDLILDDPELVKDIEYVQPAAEILCSGELDSRIRKLFKRGDTFLLIPEAMKHIDLPHPQKNNTLIEIIVTDGDKEEFIEHKDIIF